MSAIVERFVEVVGRFYIPASLAYTGSAIYGFVKSVPEAVDDMTVVEAVARISETAILSIPQVLGGIGLLMGGYLSYQLKQAKQATLDHVEAMKHEQEMAKLGHPIAPEASSKFALDPRCAKPGDDTVDLR